MDNVFSYKDNYFLNVDGKDIPAPLPGDILIEKEESARVVLSSELSEEEVHVTLLGEKTWIPGKGGRKVWVAVAETVSINKDNLSKYIIRRGGATLFPLPFFQKIINFLIKLNIKIKLKFKKN
jgi:hypothetical protein